MAGPEHRKGSPHRELSTVSKQYDFDGDGKLDEAEQALRNMEAMEPSGQLSNEKVYALMRKQLTLQHQNVTQRKLIIGLSAFAAVLALANMGTAFAAARLAQDTSLSGPPEVSSSSGTTQQRRLEGGNTAASANDEYVPQDVMISKNDGNIVGTRTVSGSHVNLDVVYTETHGYDDTGIMPVNKLPWACVDLPTLAGMYNTIADGSTAAVRIRNENANVEAGEMQNSAEAFGRVGASDGTVAFYPLGGGNAPGLTVALEDDRCEDETVVPTRRGLRKKADSSRRKLARSQRVRKLFQGLTHADARVRRAAQRILEAVDDNNVENTETKEDDVGDDVEEQMQTDAEYVAEALGLEDIAEDEIGSDSESLSDVEFMNQIFGEGQFDTPFFYTEDVNRVPVFVNGNFYFDDVPEDGVENLPVYDPEADLQDEQDGSGSP